MHRRRLLLAAAVAAGLLVVSVAALLSVDGIRSRVLFRSTMLMHGILKSSKSYQAEGAALYEQHCSSCHGISGVGGRGPDLRRGQRTDIDLLHIVQNGTEGGMPRFGQMLSDRQILHVIAHVQGRRDATPSNPRGDARNGQSLFVGRAGCQVCHTIGMNGGTIGPDLTRIGAGRGADYLRAKLLSPGSEVQSAYRMVRVQGPGKTEIRGLLVNEDTFSVQLREPSGVLRSFMKSELVSYSVLTGESLMPSYADVLLPTEIDDVVAFLATQVGS